MHCYAPTELKGSWGHLPSTKITLLRSFMILPKKSHPEN
jgi:hypothetical protein